MKRSPLGHKLNWKPSRPRLGWPTWKSKHPEQVTSPKIIDFRDSGWVPPILDQGQEGDCTGESGAGACGVLQLKGIADFKPDSGLGFTPFSGQFAYYNARMAEGDPDQDNGASISDLVGGLQTYGICFSEQWPTESGNYATRPNPEAFTEGFKHRLAYPLKLDNTEITQLLACIAGGHPFQFGITAYNSLFGVGSNGAVPMPYPENGDEVAGGHALYCVGYNSTSKMFIVANSWGVGQGDKGFYYFPFAYLTNPDLASDFWAYES